VLFLASVSTLSAIDAVSSVASAQDRLIVYEVKPSDTDSRIERFDAPHLILFYQHSEPQNLFLFMSGTGGMPAEALSFLKLAAKAGYRVVSLAYNDEPAIAQACFRTLSTSCAERVRQKRIFGDNVSKDIDDYSFESIVSRLTRLLIKLDEDHPDDGWSSYLSNGNPLWPRIAVAGHSQGGGMASFIAKRESVARVVVLSGGWDKGTRGASRRNTEDILASWYAIPSVTPPEKWFAAYHAKEPNAKLIATSYQMMHIPDANIRVIVNEPHRSSNYHSSVVGNSANRLNWEYLIGRSRAN
jgi:hypothetical protein